MLICMVSHQRHTYCTLLLTIIKGMCGEGREGEEGGKGRLVFILSVIKDNTVYRLEWHYVMYVNYFVSH